jgi:hypothetical protein
MVSKSNKQLGSILIIILVVVGLLWVFMNYSNKNIQNDGNYVHKEQTIETETLDLPGTDNNNMILNAAPANLDTNDATMGSQNAYSSLENMRNQSCFPKEQLTANDLLPQNNSSTWAQVNPSGEGNLKDKNFLQAGHHIGINTVGQTLRNANLQLRSEPPNPQVIVSPWNQSTIDPDMNRKSFEIGGSA